MKSRSTSFVSRRRALAPIAGFALAAIPLARTAAQEAPPGTVPLMTAEQKTQLATALRYVRFARAQVNRAYPSTATRRPMQFISALDAAIAQGEIAAAGRWR